MIQRFFITGALIVFVSSNVSYASGLNGYFLSASLGVNSLKTTQSLDLSRLHMLTESGVFSRLSLGYGLRFSSFQGRSLDYTTANADLIKEKRIHHLKIDDASTYSLNVGFYSTMVLASQLHFQFNIDVVGLGFGPEVIADYEGSRIRAKPTSTSQLRGGFPDIGQLNSEIVFLYLLSERWVLKAGYSHFFSEYTTQSSLDDGNDRFRHIADNLVFGASYKF